jgi:hypothetical protein
MTEYEIELIALVQTIRARRKRQHHALVTFAIARREIGHNDRG